jgi:hypothetical protein
MTHPHWLQADSEFYWDGLTVGCALVVADYEMQPRSSGDEGS